CQQHTNYPWTF
nr:immunoglobulin light chain junction region [Macaca mulatta]MOV76352.1 immunoglobulin light chain junction region [Macaca mulatta]